MVIARNGVKERTEMFGTRIKDEATENLLWVQIPLQLRI